MIIPTKPWSSGKWSNILKEVNRESGGGGGGGGGGQQSRTIGTSMGEIKLNK